ncbi:chorismate mutase [Kutzneria sp. NPDC052558]|uniref:chorismate mutase n=1 Tax=Kutzneria sp. NPDC052558 TaxID=3364121 RepID=UPI0037CC24AE
MDVRSTSLSRRAALTGLGGVALLAAAACSPSKEATSTLPANQVPPVPTADPNASIDEQRKIIDGLDKQIIELLKQRGEAAATVQKIRTSGGGQQTDPAREQAVIASYTAGLGANGASVAKAIIGADGGTAATPTSTTATSTSH